MFKIDRNILGERHDALYNLASKEMKELYDAPLGNNNLLVLKRSKKEIKEGDIFLVSIEPGVYFYGKVFEAKIVNKESDWVNGNYLIFIFKCKTHNKDLNDYKPNYDEIITGPCIVTDYYWKKGWFETIGNIPLTKEEKELDYGFLTSGVSINEWYFCKSNSERIDYIPKIIDIFGVCTYICIYCDIKMYALLIDRSIIENENIYEVFPLLKEEDILSPFEKKINPFYMVKNEDTYSVCLDTDKEYCKEIFETRKDEGSEGNGYEWEAIAKAYIKEYMKACDNKFEFDSEAGMLCINCSKKKELKDFIIQFKKFCENKEKLLEIFTQIDID